MDTVDAGAVTITALRALPDGTKDRTRGGVLWIGPKFFCLSKGWTRAFGTGAFCVAEEDPVDVVAAGVVTIEASEVLHDGSKDLTLGGGVSSIDPSLQLRFWCEWCKRHWRLRDGGKEGGLTEAKDLPDCANSTQGRCFASGKLASSLFLITNTSFSNLYLLHCFEEAS